MNWWLAYNIALGVGLVIALAWAYEARKYAGKACRLVLRHEQPTEEIPLLRAGTTMKVGQAYRVESKLEDFWPPERR